MTIFSMDDHDCVTEERSKQSYQVTYTRRKLIIRQRRPPANFFVFEFARVHMGDAYCELHRCIRNFEIIGKNSIKYNF